MGEKNSVCVGAGPVEAVRRRGQLCRISSFSLNKQPSDLCCAQIAPVNPDGLTHLSGLICPFSPLHQHRAIHRDGPDLLKRGASTWVTRAGIGVIQSSDRPPFCEPGSFHHFSPHMNPTHKSQRSRDRFLLSYCRFPRSAMGHVTYSRSPKLTAHRPDPTEGITCRRTTTDRVLYAAISCVFGQSFLCRHNRPEHPVCPRHPVMKVSPARTPARSEGDLPCRSVRSASSPPPSPPPASSLASGIAYATWVQADDVAVNGSSETFKPITLSGEWHGRSKTESGDAACCPASPAIVKLTLPVSANNTINARIATIIEPNIAHRPHHRDRQDHCASTWLEGATSPTAILVPGTTTRSTLLNAPSHCIDGCPGHLPGHVVPDRLDRNRSSRTGPPRPAPRRFDLTASSNGLAGSAPRILFGGAGRFRLS